MNENILAISEPAESSEGSPERENNDRESLDEQVAALPLALAANQNEMSWLISLAI